MCIPEALVERVGAGAMERGRDVDAFGAAALREIFSRAHQSTPYAADSIRLVDYKERELRDR